MYAVGMVFLLYGEDSFRARKTLIASRERFSSQRDASGLNVVTLRYGEADADCAMSELFASPFLAVRKLVVLEGFLSASSPEQERLKDALGRLPESTVAVFFEVAGPDALSRAPLFPFLKDQKYSVEHQPLSSLQAAAFLEKEASRIGASIGRAATAALLEAVGSDSGALANALDMLVAHAAAHGRSEIAAADVSCIASSPKEESVFAIVDAILSDDGARAGRAISDASAAGIAEPQLLALLLKQVKTLFLAFEAVRLGKDAAFLAASAGVHQYAAKKAIAAVRHHRKGGLDDYHRLLTDTERDFMTGSRDVYAKLLLAAAHSLPDK